MLSEKKKAEREKRIKLEELKRKLEEAEREEKIAYWENIDATGYYG